MKIDCLDAEDEAECSAGISSMVPPNFCDVLLGIESWTSVVIARSCFIYVYLMIFRDALVVSVLDTITSIISGLVTFSILGATAHDLGVNISSVVKEGPGLAFVAYPEALLRLPVPQLW